MLSTILLWMVVVQWLVIFLVVTVDFTFWWSAIICAVTSSSVAVCTWSVMHPAMVPCSVIVLQHDSCVQLLCLVFYCLFYVRLVVVVLCFAGTISGRLQIDVCMFNRNLIQKFVAIIWWVWIVWAVCWCNLHSLRCIFSQFLRRISIACYAERCISYSKSVHPSVRPSICPSHAGTVSKRLKLRSWGLHWRIAPWL